MACSRLQATVAFVPDGLPLPVEPDAGGANAAIASKATTVGNARLQVRYRNSILLVSDLLPALAATLPAAKPGEHPLAIPRIGQHMDEIAAPAPGRRWLMLDSCLAPALGRRQRRVIYEAHAH